MVEPLGAVLVEGDQAAIVLERVFAYPIARVWEALTDPPQLSVWFGPAQVRPGVGGSYTLEAGPADVPVAARRTEGQILAWDPPHILEFEWRQALVEPSTVRYELSEVTDGTSVKLVHRWLSVQNARSFIPGQHAFLDRLEAFLAGEPVPDWGERYAALQAAYIAPGALAA